MRELTDEARLRELMRRFGRLRSPCVVYLTGGATALLHGWRRSTVHADLIAEPETDEFFRLIRQVKDDMSINIELAAPSHFVPELPSWRDRSVLIGREGVVEFRHYDPYSQALSKIERDHDRDRDDVRAMIERGLVELPRLRELFEAIEPDLIRYPAIDAARFRERVEALQG